MSLARFGVTKPVPVNLLMFATLIAGAVAGLTITREFFPDITPKSARITLPYPGATPQEIEETLARKVEDKLADLDEVDEIITTLAEGGGGIVVKFHDRVADVTKAIDEVERAIDSLIDLPEEAEKIQVAEIEPTLPAIMVSLFGEADEASMKTAIRGIRDELRLLPGMGTIQITGVRPYEVRVDLDADVLLAHSISLPQVAEVVRAWMTDVPGGTVRTGTGNVNVRTMGVAERAAAIRDIVVKATPDGQVLRVRDIGRVREGFVDEQIITRFRTPTHEGRSASLTINRVGDQDAVDIAEMVRAYVRARNGEPFEPKFGDRVASLIPGYQTKRQQAYELGLNSAVPLPGDTTLAIHSDLARFIEGRLDLLLRNGASGLALVFATLLIFLNWRAAFWVGVGLFTALSGTLVVMALTGTTLNLLTMFGMIIVVGLLVDDAIVVAENIQSRHDRNESSLVAAIKGTEQVFWPVVATVTTTIVAFLPLKLIGGDFGDMLGALPLVVACALIMSLIEAVYMLPSHMAHSLHHRDKVRHRAVGSWLMRAETFRDHIIADRIIPTYARVLELSLRFRYVSLAAVTALLILTIGFIAGGRLGWEFIPSSDAETIIVDLRMPVGSPLSDTQRIVERIERASIAQDETVSVASYVGVRTNAADILAIAPTAFAPHLAQMFVELKAVEQRSRESQAIIASIRESLGPLDGVDRVSFTEIQGGPSGPAITIDVSGTDEGEIMAAVSDLKSHLAEYEGVVDVADDQNAGQREVQVALKSGAAALGFTVADVARQVRGALFGIDAHVFSDRQEDIDVRVRLDETSRQSLHAIENLWLISPSHQRVSLSEIAELTEGTSYSTIKRIDRRRTVSVTADTVPGISADSITMSLPLDELRRKHPNVRMEYGGQQEQQLEAFASLPYGFGAALIGIYVLLAWLFGSYTQPIAVMIAIPFGVVGVCFGHWLMGYTLTFMSVIGFVALSGIVVNDSLILVQFYNARRAEGVAMLPALVVAGRERLRAIFLTTITTVLGLTPLMLEQSFQAKFLIPMAISVSFGLMFTTVLVLGVLPCILVIVDDLKAVAYYLWHGRRRPKDTDKSVSPFNLETE